VKRHHDLLIGERTAEDIKATIGSALPLDEPLTMEVKGRDLGKGVPKRIILNDTEVREALAEPLKIILRAIREGLDQVPPELSADIYDRGIALCGGGSMLRNLDRLIREETRLPVQVVEDPLTAVVVGAGRILSDDVLLKKLSLESDRGRRGWMSGS
jgi:rod shape-determining protein MreB